MTTAFLLSAASWPPYLVEAGAAPGDGFAQVARNNRTNQWTKDGVPLYFWVGDTAPADANGDGIGGVWRIAK